MLPHVLGDTHPVLKPQYRLGPRPQPCELPRDPVAIGGTSIPPHPGAAAYDSALHRADPVEVEGAD
jgi:hypothetical protein